MKKILLFVFAFCIINISLAQDFTNKGKDFYIPYAAHIDGTSSAMGIYITSDVNATGTITVGSQVLTFSVLANTVTRKFIGPTLTGDAPNTSVYLSQDDGIAVGAAIHVVADKPVAVYAHIIRSARSAATLVLPTAVWGKEYVVPSYRNYGTSASYGAITVMAAEANTVINVTPSVSNKNGTKVAGTSYTITLANPGDVYQLQFAASADISGTKVQSVAGAGSTTCKKIAVFSSTTWSAFDCTGSSGGDNLYQQLFPVASWGKNFITSPFIYRGYDIVRVFVNSSATVVKKTENGVVSTLTGLQANSYYEFKTANPTFIQSDQPVSVVQYITSTTCKTGCTTGSSNVACLADPEMVVLNPIEQTINNITVFSAHRNWVPSGQSSISNCYLNIVIKTNSTASFKINGASPSGVFKQIPGTLYSYLQEEVTSTAITNPVQTLKADSNFIAIAYGFGNVESYGYNAGTSVKDFTKVATFQNQFARLDSAVACVNSPFTFSVPLSFQPTTLKWDFASAPNIVPSTTVGPISSPTSDSVVNSSGQVLYYYSTKNAYQFSKSNTSTLRDTIKVYTTSATADGCGSTEQIYSIPVKVTDLPDANFTIGYSGCLTDAVQFLDATNTKGDSKVIAGLWDFNDSTTDSAYNPNKLFLQPKTYNVRYRPITNYGCVGDTTIALTFSSPPIAKFGINDTTCVGNTITFTDSSSILGGSIVKWYWDYGNGKKDTLTTNASRTQVYNVAGTYTVSLVVENNTGCKSNAFTKALVIHPFPVTNFIIPTVVCLPQGAATFTNTTTIIDTSTTFKYAWDFGDGGIDSVKNPTHNFSAVGPFNVKLTATSVFGCVKDTTKSIATIYPQAKANFSIVNQPCFRDTTYFKDSTDGKGSAISSWRWTFGDTSSDTLQDSKHRYASSGSYSVSLYTITDKGCSSDTVTKTAVVNPLPQVGFTATASAYCETRPVTFTDTSKIATGSITRWHWLLGDGRVVDTTNNNAFTHSYATYGSYTVKLMAESDKGCKSDTFSQTVTINPLPQVGFVVPEICLADAAAQFTDTSKIADGTQASFTYSWNLNVTGITPVPTPFTALTVKNPSAKYYKSDNYQVSATVTSNKGCAVTLQQPFTVNGSIPVPGFAVQNATKLCANDSVALLDTSYIDFGAITKVEIVWDNLNSPTVIEIDDNPTSGNNKQGKLYKHLYPNFYNPLAPKTIQIKFTAYSGTVCVNSITKNITLNPSPRVQFTVIPGICKDTIPRQITQATETTGIAGTFVYTGTATNSTGIVTPSNIAVGTYNIQYKYTSTAGCADSATQAITVWPSPVAKWGVSSPMCEKNNITFTDSSVANYSNIQTWQWVYGDGNTANKTTGIAYNYSYAAAGTYTASLRVVTDSGCRSQVNTQTIKVNDLPKVSFTMPTICLPDGNGTFTSTSTIADGSQNLFSYSWNFGDPNNATGSTSQSASHQYSALAPTAGYPVKLIITTKDGCVDSLTQAYTDVNPQPTAAFTAIPTAVCVRDNISFTDQSNGKTSAVTKWYWDLAQGQTNSNNTQNPSRQFNDSGTYQIRLWVDNAQGCRSDTATQTVTIHPYPILELGSNLVVLEGGTIAIKPQIVYGNNLSYLWTAIAPAGSPTYLSSDTAAIPISTPIASVDSITYRLQLTGIGGCAVSDQITVVVLKTPVIPNTFSPNNDRINDTWVIKSLESYPGATIEIYNRYGQLVYKATGYDPNNAWDGKLNGTPLPVGTYYYIINPKNGRSTLSGSVTIIR